MSESFDPYHVWLGIPPESRPPTHYELLGISPNEHEKAVIEAAVLRQSGYVRNFQIGKYGKDAARILNEIGAAKGCLLDPVKRAKYDAELKATRPAPIQIPSRAAQAPIAPAPVPPPAIDLDLLATTATSPALRPVQHRRTAALTLKAHRRKVLWRLPAGIGISVCMVMAAVAFWSHSALEPPLVAIGTVVPNESAELDGAAPLPRAVQPQRRVDRARSAAPPPRSESNKHANIKGTGQSTLAANIDPLDAKRPPTPASLPPAPVSSPILAEAKTDAPRDRANDWTYGYARIDGDAVSDFTQFPCFIESMWRRSVAFGVPLLHAAGGHPAGPDEAIIRRWVSPSAGVVSVKGTLAHPSNYAETDGVRGRVITGRGGTKRAWRVRTGTAATDVGMFSVAASESVDFVVDCLRQVRGR